jgi:hypothetical protein
VVVAFDLGLVVETTVDHKGRHCHLVMSYSVYVWVRGSGSSGIDQKRASGRLFRSSIMTWRRRTTITGLLRFVANLSLWTKPAIGGPFCFVVEQAARLANPILFAESDPRNFLDGAVAQ